MSEYLDFTKLKRPGKPNNYLVLPEGFPSSATADSVSPEFSAKPEDVFDALVSAAVEAGAKGSLLADLSTRRMRYVATTAILRFKDDVDAAVIDGGDGTSTIAIYSRSRIGYSDLGANRKRVEKLLNAVEAHIKA